MIQAWEKASSHDAFLDLMLSSCDVMRRQIFALAWELAHRGGKPDMRACLSKDCEARIHECAMCWEAWSKEQALKLLKGGADEPAGDRGEN